MKSSSTISPALTEIASKVLQDSAGFAGLSVFPLFPTAAISAHYWTLADAEQMDIPQNIRHAPGSGFSRSQTKLSEDSYKCFDFGHEEPVSDEENGKYARKGAAEEVATRRAETIILVNHELRVKAKATSADVPKASPAVKWDDAASNPMDDVKAARKAVFDGCGFDANVMVVGREVFEALKSNLAIKDRIKISDKDSRWPQLLGVLFDVEQFVVAKARVNLAQEGQALDMGLVWGDSVILAHVDTLEDFKAVSFGRTFIHGDEKNPLGVTVEVYRQENISSNVVRAEQMTDEKLTAPAAGFHLEDVLS